MGQGATSAPEGIGRAHSSSAHVAVVGQRGQYLGALGRPRLSLQPQDALERIGEAGPLVVVGEADMGREDQVTSYDPQHDEPVMACTSLVAFARDDDAIEVSSRLCAELIMYYNT